jgi:hypothetical protein
MQGAKLWSSLSARAAAGSSIILQEVDICHATPRRSIGTP